MLSDTAAPPRKAWIAATVSGAPPVAAASTVIEDGAVTTGGVWSWMVT